MAVTHVETVATDCGATTTPDPDNVGASGRADGNLLLAFIVTDTPHAITTPPSGWTQIVVDQEDTAADTGLSAYWKIASSEPAAYTNFLTFTATENSAIAISAWSGVDTTTPMDVAMQSEGSAVGLPKDTPPITPVTSGAVLVAVFGADPGAARTFVWDGGIDVRLADYITPSGVFAWITIGSKTWGGGANETLGGDFITTGEPTAELVVALRPSATTTTDTFPIAAASDDGGGSKVSATWAGVPGASFNVSDATIEGAGKSFFTGDYYSFLTFLRWDTSSLPDGATITGANLLLYIDALASSDNIQLAADYYDFGGTPSVAADWEQSSSADAIAPFLITGLTAGVVNSIPLTGLAGINLSGFTGLRIAAANTTIPTGDNYIESAAYDHATFQEPRLEVTYTTGAADQLMPPHRAVGGGLW